METLRWYLQQRKDNETIVFDHTVKKYGCPALFYAVARNSVEAIQILIQYGANPNDNDCPGIPLLAFAILYGKRKPTNITGVVKQLLAHGADPLVIPQDMWIDYIHDPKIACPTSPSKQAKWFNAEYRTGLVAALHLTQRYLLYRASRLKKLTDRELQLGSDHKIANLFRVPYFMIGQLPAAGLVMETVFSHVTNNNPVPLVMVFAGPSGHGKTELAEQMGDLLSVKHQVFNCSEWHSRIDILGGSNAYRRSEQGSILNNFVSENDGRRAVVVLDEFDKTTDEVRLSLLNVINRGTFVDLRNNRKINSSKLIWIFATNFGDALIEGFYKRNVQHLSKEKQETVNLAPLQRDLMEAFRSTYGAPLAGRTRLMVPFLPFSQTEAAVVFHKFFLDYQDRKRADIDLREDVNQHIGHIDVGLYQDGDFSSCIAEKYYDPATGARSLRNAVDVVEMRLTKEYVRQEGLVTEAMNEKPLQKYMVRTLQQGNRDFDIAVHREAEAD